jgi:hypothetical protein
MNQGLIQSLQKWGRRGTVKDVDRIMQVLLSYDDMATIKTVDFALDLVRNPDGVHQIHYYLFNGRPRQRNYAALWCKRRRQTGFLDQAYKKGLVDENQAFAV